MKTAETPEDRLCNASLVLPEPPAPSAHYVPAKRSQGFLDISGQVPFVDGALRTGRVGAEISAAEAVEMAAVAASNAVAIARSENGTLNGLEVHRVRVFVVGAPGFTDQHLVADGASNYLTNLFGELGQHSRTSIGVAALPLGAPVEVEITFSIT